MFARVANLKCHYADIDINALRSISMPYIKTHVPIERKRSHHSQLSHLPKVGKYLHRDAS